LNIQLINYSGLNDYEFEVSEISKLSKPMSFEEYDLNIIDLRSNYIWRNKNPYTTSQIINVINDFNSLKNLINRTEKSNILLVLPGNLDFKANYNSHVNEYEKSIKLKDMMKNFNNLLKEIHGLNNLTFLYESTRTKLDGETLSSDFIIEPNRNLTTHIKSNKSERIVSISKDNLYVSTLNIKDNPKLTVFLEQIGLIDDQIVVPEWLEETDYFDDAEKKELINKNKNKIEKLDVEIDDATHKLEENNRYKSILYSSGDDLVSIIREILEEILEIDLTDFEDEFNEDLRFNYKNDIYIIEIKGNNKGIRLNNITQLHNHTITFIEDNNENETDKIEYDNIYSLLIMTPQRMKPLNQRDDVDEDIIEDAKHKYDALIIRSKDLLKSFEKIQNHEMDQDEFVELIQKKGLFNK